MSEHTGLSGEIEAAASTLSAYWPLTGFVAINPLRGWDSLPFEEAAAEACRLHGGSAYLRDDDTPPPPRGDKRAWSSPAAAVNRHLIQALSAFCDQGQAHWSMPGRERGFYRAWRAVACFDPSLPGRKQLRALPDDALACVRTLTADIAPSAARVAFFEEQLHALPGWAAYLRRRAHQHDTASARQAPVSLTDFLAVRLALCHSLGVPPATSLVSAQPHRDDAGAAQLRARETRWRQPLLQSLAQRSGSDDEPVTLPSAQLVFCIDVRSEVLRRHLEKTGPYETLGFAGFFGLPIAWQPLDAAQAVTSCPGLVDPQHLVREQPSARDDAALARWRRNRHWRDAGKRLVDTLKSGIATPFAFVEASGWLYGYSTARANLAPASGHEWHLPPREAMRIDLGGGDGSGIRLKQQIFYAEAALSTMGLTQRFAPIVVFCGHACETINNPYSSALDCGACAGQSGEPNARVLAHILNQSAVRSALAERGIAIPETTRFMAAEHNTTTDAVTLPEDEAQAPDHRKALARLRDDLQRARAAAAAERCRALPGVSGNAVTAVERRARDWSEVRPEWGLAGNAALIVAPRTLTRDLDLAGRCFLHSYDWHSDPKGRALEVILTAPMVVAHWINAQYYFSTVDPEVFGAGTKTTQTVVGSFGVMQGNGSDLMTGLPRQSVLRPDGTPQHEPLRLLTVVHAPIARIEKIIQRHTLLQRLFDNEWVALAALPPEGGEPLMRLPGGTWQAPEAGDSFDPPLRASKASTPSRMEPTQ